MCHGRFRHLARKIDAPAPACPRCDNPDVERMVTAANVVHSEAHHRKELEAAKPQVDQDDPEAIARFLQESGRLEDAEGVYDSPEYKELIYRRAQGATDEDLSDLVEGLTEEMQSPRRRRRWPARCSSPNRSKIGWARKARPKTTSMILERTRVTFAQNGGRSGMGLAPIF